MRARQDRQADGPRRQWLEALFEAHHAKLLAYALRRTAGLADAEEIVAETFVVAWRRADDVPDQALGWLYGVARRLIANQRRGTARRLRLMGRLQAEATDARPPSALADEVHAALRRLRAQDRELLQLVAWEELGHTEIARVLGITPNAVAIRLYRARARLQQELQAPDSRAKGSRLARTFNSWKGNVTGRSEREAK